MTRWSLPASSLNHLTHKHLFDQTRIKFDPLAHPMPEIPFPIDLATVIEPAPTKNFNSDQYMINLIGRYFQTRGRELLESRESDNHSCLEDKKGILGKFGDTILVYSQA